MGYMDIFGVWLSVFLTLSIFSYLYKDNPFYKAAEHLYIGISAGYVAVISFWQQIQPNLFGRLWPRIDSDADIGIFKSAWYFIYEIFNWVSTLGGWLDRSIFPENGIKGFNEISWMYIIPFILGIFMLLRLVPRLGWLARWSIAYIVGMAAGLRFYGFLNSDVLMQLKAATIDFSGDWWSIFNGLVLLIGTLSGLVYFFFSKEHSGVVGKVSKVGIYFLMIKFGASFGFAVMGRISLLIGRFDDLIIYNSPQNHHATMWILTAMVALLGIWAIFDKPKTEDLKV
jgi:hypothetical protein